MIKFIASDMDGTILLNGAQSVDADTLFTVKRCLDSGIIFAAASGRQTASLRMLFGKLSDQMLTIAENGAMVTYHNEIIHKAVLDHDLAMDITPRVCLRSFLTPFAANSPFICQPGPPVPLPLGSPP